MLLDRVWRMDIGRGYMSMGERVGVVHMIDPNWRVVMVCGVLWSGFTVPMAMVIPSTSSCILTRSMGPIPLTVSVV
jgi:hypothetical protein